MKAELQKQIYKAFPKIFRLKNTSIKMSFGLECNDGWYWLIYHLCSNIQAYVDSYNKYNKIKITQAVARQVKEKFGGLSFYYGGGDLVTDGMVDFAEHLSYHICENCGSNENVTQTKGYIQSLCEKCQRNLK